MIDPPFSIGYPDAGVIISDTTGSRHGRKALSPDSACPTYLPIGTNKGRQIKVGDSRAVESRSPDLLGPLVGNKAVAACGCLQPPRLALLLTVVAGDVMSLFVTAGVRDPLILDRDDACSWFVRNSDESD
jgi:hypothetical protein